MTFRAIRLALLPASLIVAGCGTVANLANSHPEQGGTAPFGGVRHDMSCLKQASNGEFGLRARPKSESERYPQRALIAFCAADLPFSLIGDLVTWPFTVVYGVINEPIPTPPAVVVSPPAIQTAPSTTPATPPMPLPLPPAIQPTAASRPKTAP